MAETKTDVLPAEPSRQKDRNPVNTLAKMIESRAASFGQVATKYLTAERLVKLAQVAVSKNHALADCSTLSVIECLMTCSMLGLEPNGPGGVWLVPFKRECTSIIDYRGMIDVVRRSGKIMAVHADVRCEKDHWKYMIDTAGATMVTLQHSPADGDRGPIMGAFFVAKLEGGECQATYLSKDQIDGFRERSKADKKGFSPWKTDYVAMAIKTACRRGVNLLPRTPEVQMLREALHREDEFDGQDIMGDLPESAQAAIERLLTAISEKDADLGKLIAEALAKTEYGPAKKLQVLTRYQEAPAELLKVLQAEAGDVAQLPEAKPVERIEKPAAAVKEEVPAKRKPGRPKKAAAAPSEPKPPAEDKKPAREFKGSF